MPFTKRAPLQKSSWVFLLLSGVISCFAQSILPNGSFEESDVSSVISWKTSTWAGKADFQIVPEGYSGGQCAKITSKEDGADAAWQAVVPVEMHTT